MKGQTQLPVEVTSDAKTRRKAPTFQKQIMSEPTIHPSHAHSKHDCTGLVVKLPPDVANQFRRSDPGERCNRKEVAEWDELLIGTRGPGTSTTTASVLTNAASAKRESQVDATGLLDTDTSDTGISLPPPHNQHPRPTVKSVPHEPELWIIWEQLLGYTPTSIEEVKVLQSHLQSTLWLQGVSAENDGNKSIQCDEDPMEKLFQARVILHGVSSEIPPSIPSNSITDDKVSEGSFPIGRIKYPDFIPCNAVRHLNNDPKEDFPVGDDQSEEQQYQLLSVANIWSSLHQPHSVAVVRRVQEHLCHCHRPLTWKFAMWEELKRLVQVEQSRSQHEELNSWNHRQRRSKLQDLYLVRETFQHKLEQAEQQWKVLEHKRRRLMKHHLLLLALNDDVIISHSNENAKYTQSFAPELIQEFLRDFESGSDGDSLNGNDFDAADYFDEANEEDDDNQEIHAIEAHGNSGRENKAESRDACLESENEEDEGTDHNKNDSLASHDTITKEREYTRQRTLLEQKLNDECTSLEWKKAKAAVLILDERIGKIDELLETLQEEEWALEEDEEEKQNIRDRKSKCHDDLESTSNTPRSSDRFGLLDRILAMVLGATFPVGEYNQEMHTRYLQEEHFSIVREWRETFGRLPHASSDLLSDSSNSEVATPLVNSNHIGRVADKDPAQHRQLLGIVENHDCDWDEEPLSEETAVAVTPAKRGLRPGGRVG